MNSALINFLAKNVAFFTLIISTYSCGNYDAEDHYNPRLNIIPTPSKVLTRGGVVIIADDLWVIVNVSDSISSKIATVLVDKLVKLTNNQVLITDLFSTRKHKQSISLEINESILANEAYSLKITSAQISIKAGHAAGLNYGVESLLQILKQCYSDHLFTIPKMVISDNPKTKNRGVLVNQNQLENEVTEELLIEMAKLKLNSLIVYDYYESKLNISRLALKHNIKVLDATDLPDGAMKFTLDTEKKKISGINFVNLNSEYMVLDISNSSPINSDLQLDILSELSWSKPNFDSIEALNQWILDYYLSN